MNTDLRKIRGIHLKFFVSDEEYSQIEVLDGRVEKVIITDKDRLSRVSFELFYHLFKKYHCEIIVMSEISSVKLDSEEIFEEIISLLHCYSMKLYSKRKVGKIKKVLEEDDRTEG